MNKNEIVQTTCTQPSSLLYRRSMVYDAWRGQSSPPKLVSIIVTVHLEQSPHETIEATFAFERHTSYIRGYNSNPPLFPHKRDTPDFKRQHSRQLPRLQPAGRSSNIATHVRRWRWRPQQIRTQRSSPDWGWIQYKEHLEWLSP